MGIYSFTGTAQFVTVSTTGEYDIVAFGAQGGTSSGVAGGLGAEIAGAVQLTAGEKLEIIVGGQGTATNVLGSDTAGGGGGGTFLLASIGGAYTPLLIAGGGGGAARDSGAAGGAGQIGSGSGYGGPGGASVDFFSGGGGGGAGVKSQGGNSPFPGGSGGTNEAGGYAGGGTTGGFGGGGAGIIGGGGGGGYSGGAGGSGGTGSSHTAAAGAGGGSFDAGVPIPDQTSAGANVGNGRLFIIPVCFVTGTHILTTRGDCAVEDLAVGDFAVTASGKTRPIVWIGRRDTDCRGRHELHPVRVAAHAFGTDLPVRDLWLSPGHPVLLRADEDNEGGHLVPIMCLINGTTIARVAVDEVTYWHIELDQHDILLAENLPAESYIDLGSRPWFADADGALYDPDMALPGIPGRCRPVAIDGPVVEATRRQLDAAFALRLTDACIWPTNDADAVAL